MEAYLEALVCSYLTRGGKVFVNPQFNITWDKVAGQGGALPDFVALDFENMEYVVVEVTTAKDLSGLIKKIENRKIHWFPPLQRHLKQFSIINDSWTPRFLGFVRDSHVSYVNKLFAEEIDVHFYPLEKALLEYAYSVERKDGLPRPPMGNLGT